MQLWKGDTIPEYDEKIPFVPYITPYLIENAHCGIVVCPGGGYEKRMPHEGKVYAEWLNSIGVSAVVLEYRVFPYKAPAPAADVQRAMRIARELFKEHGTTKVGIMGSSAGGHLAATISVHHDINFYKPEDEIDMISSRPDFTILCYPVIDMHEYRHDISRINLLGNITQKAEKDFYSLQMCVSDDTPPAFIWHTQNDPLVPVENSLFYASALAEHNISYELHIFPDGRHGMGLAKDHPYVCQWVLALERWLKTYI